jgi:hypothetical protein
MKKTLKILLSGLWLLGPLALATLTTGCQVDLVDDHGYHHNGYYDWGHHWHGGYYDKDHVYHTDADDWHK